MLRYYVGTMPNSLHKWVSGWAKKVSYGEAGWFDFEGIKVGVGKIWLENL